MSHHNILTVAMPREAQEVELKRRFSMLMNRLERVIEEVNVGFNVSKLYALSRKMKNGEYFMYAENDKKKLMLQFDWAQLEKDVAIAMYQSDDVTNLNDKIRDDIFFESNKQYRERMEELRKEKVQYLEVRYCVLLFLY